MIAFHYKFTCPLCGQTYSSGLDVLLAPGKEDAVEMVLQKHQICPFCIKSLVGLEVNVTVFLSRTPSTTISHPSVSGSVRTFILLVV